MKSRLIPAVWRALRDRGIAIACLQMDAYLDPGAAAPRPPKPRRRAERRQRGNRNRAGPIGAFSSARSITMCWPPGRPRVSLSMRKASITPSTRR